MTPLPDQSHARASGCPTASSRSTGWRATSPGPGTSRSPPCSGRSTPTGLDRGLRQPRRDARRAAARDASRRWPATPASASAWRAPRPAWTSAWAPRAGTPSLPEAPAAIAYFSPEFGLSEALPQYSGGLGILAGDHLKAASDLGVPIVGIGLFYRNGYFRQVLTASGAQQEEFVELDPALLPMTPCSRRRRRARRDLRAAAGRDAARRPLARRRRPRAAAPARHGRARPTRPAERAVTDRLYGGDSEHRLRQEILLGIGGVKALAACGVEPAVFHMNEGHAGFLALERVRSLVEDGVEPEHALQLVRARTVFTTHTPVPAGIDRFSHDLMARYFGQGGVPTGLPLERLLALGAEAGGDAGVFNMAALGIRMAARVNGVSRLHGERGARDVRAALPGRRAPTTCRSPTSRTASTPRPGSGPSSARSTARAWAMATARARRAGSTSRPSRTRSCSRRARTPACASSTRCAGGWRARRASAATIAAESAWLAGVLDPQALTLGFARRVPTYKRLTLLLHERERLTRILTSAERPVQLLVAGKAHPHDGEGKRLIEEFGAFAAGHDVRHRVIMLADYDMALAGVLVSGVDVWLNTPLRPLEACGTSGMKAALNGVLNLSILDGWWDECYAPAFGWAIPSAEEPGLDPAHARRPRGGVDPRPDRARARAALLRARRRPPPRLARDDPAHALRARPAAAGDAHAARLRRAAVPADGRGARGRRRRALTRCSALVAEATIGAVHKRRRDEDPGRIRRLGGRRATRSRAQAEIARHGNDVTVISVVPLQASGPRSAGPIISGDVEEHGRELQEAVAKLKEAGVEAETIEAVGHPAESIVDEAERGGFDLIVVGPPRARTASRASYWARPRSCRHPRALRRARRPLAPARGASSARLSRSRSAARSSGAERRQHVVLDALLRLLGALERLPARGRERHQVTAAVRGVATALREAGVLELVEQQDAAVRVEAEGLHERLLRGCLVVRR